MSAGLLEPDHSNCGLHRFSRPAVASTPGVEDSCPGRPRRDSFSVRVATVRDDASSDDEAEDGDAIRPARDAVPPSRGGPNDRSPPDTAIVVRETFASGFDSHVDVATLTKKNPTTSASTTATEIAS